MKRITLAVRSVLVGVLLGCAAEALAETRVTWVGGTEGDFNVAANWDPAKVPSSSSTTAYVAVFTNSVNLSNSADYWYPAGAEVAADCDVVFSGNRVMPTTAEPGSDYVYTIGANASLKISGSIFYGTTAKKLVKKGEGLLTTTFWFGNSSNAGREFDVVEVQGGTLFAGTGDNRYNCVSNVLVRPGGTFKVAAGGGMNQTFRPCVTVEAGGTLDFGGKTLTLASLSGAGTVTNGTTLTLTLARNAGAVFEGVAACNLKITSVAETQEDAMWVVGAADTLAQATMTLSEGDEARLVFKENIHRFFAKSIPAGTYYDRQGFPVTIETSGKSWYVDPKRPDDSGDGTRRETAFRTLKAAMANADLKSGDTVWALPGEYKEGFAAPSATAVATSNRVVVKAGVKLVSTDGPEKTFIVGADSPDPYEDGFGCGPGAIRCAYLNKDSELRGFTLTGGRTANQNGGGVVYYSSNVDGGLVEDCVISNCVAARGAGANYVVCKRVRFYGNRNFSTTANNAIGAAMHHGSAYNCLFDGHKNGNYVVLYAAKVVNCSFLSGNTVNAIHYVGDFTTESVCNSVILCPSGDKACYTQCVFLDKKSNVSDENIGKGSFRLSAAAVKLDAEGRPLADSPLRDAGDNALYPREGLGCMCFDVFDKMRFSNGTIDLGACEYDASGDIAVALGRRHRLSLVPEEISAGVKVAEGGVAMSGSFQTLSATLTGTAGVTDEYELTVSVTDAGTLVVTSGGETVGTVTAADGTQTYRIAAGSDPTKLEFAFTGAGTANIGRLKSALGLLLLFR